jgi:hypothetical protein
VRNIGSGNIGATNVLRTGRKDLALATLLLDAGKGAVALLLARWLFHSDLAGAIAGGAAFFGHLFPVWLRFKGGKGVATFFGLLIAAHWPLGLMAGATWLIVAFVLRYSSLAALIAAVLAPVYAVLPLPGAGIAGGSADPDPLGRDRGADLDPPPREHRPPAQGGGTPHRREEGVSLTDAPAFRWGTVRPPASRASRPRRSRLLSPAA